MKKLYVDQDVCIGCGACVAIASDTFEFNDDGLAQVKKEFNNEELSEEEIDALEGCPTGAIKEED